MRLTRRGYGVLAVVVVAEVLALRYGAQQRPLNAVAAPAVIALVAGVVSLRRTAVPTAERESVPPGFPGDTREVTVDVDGEGVAHVSETVPDGLAATDASAERTLPVSFSYTLSCEKRGRHTLGPLEVGVRDVLGLFERRYRVGSTGSVLVYPPVYKVAAQGILREHVLDHAEFERREFDTLREYAPGDPLRDVHWKTTAKDPDEIFVTEFADRRVDHDVVIAAEATGDSVDEMATAAASIAVVAIEAALGVELRLPDGSVPLGHGPTHRENLLEALATTDGGRLDGGSGPRDDVDVHVVGDADGVTIRFDDRTESLAGMTVSRENPLVTREVES